MIKRLALMLIVLGMPSMAWAQTLNANPNGGWNTFIQTNLLTTPNTVKSTPGSLGKVYCYNPNASAAFLQVFNAAAANVTPGTTSPVNSYGIPATNAAGFAMTIGDAFSSAISIIATTTATGGTPPTSALVCTLSYK